MSGAHAKELLEQGFSVFEKAWTDAEVDRIRELLESRYEELPPRTPWGRRDMPLSDTVMLNYTGVTFYGLLQERPEIASLLLKPEILDELRGVLGPDMRLEVVGGAVTDETRPFFAWHTHIGGYDDGEIQSSGNWPVIDNARRITTLLYLDDIDEAGGLLLTYPRRVGDPTAPPFDPSLEHWEGQAEIRIPRGSLVAMEQCTWHTALPMTRPGRRMFLGCSFRAGWEPMPSWQDHSLAAAAARHPLIASVVDAPTQNANPSPAAVSGAISAMTSARSPNTSSSATVRAAGVGHSSAPSNGESEAERHARDIREQGYTILPRLWSDDEVKRLHSVISERTRRANPARLWSREGDYVPVDDISAGVHHVGLGFYRLLEEHPDLAPLVYKPRMIDVLRATLGEGMELEMTAAVVSDEGRPFLRWHSHIGGHESGFDPDRDGWPVIPSVQRVTALLYLDDIDDDSGPMLLYPRRAGDPTEPPGNYETEWEGQVEIRVPRGTMVILEQCTWHAARPKRTPGLRILMPSYFRAAGVSGPAGTRSIDPTWLSVGDKATTTTHAAAERVSDEIPSGLVAELGRLASNAVPGWSLSGVHRTKDAGLGLEFLVNGNPVDLSATPAREGQRAFIIASGVAYSYRGNLERPQAEALRHVLKRLHPVVSRLLKR